MEPVTHILTGVCLARCGLNRRAAYTTLAMAIAAEFPDIDTLWSLGGPVAGFEHHRGITHSLIGLPVEAAVIVVAVYGFHRWRARRKPTAPNVQPAAPLTAAPVRWGLLYGFCMIALLSHLFLDYTNNYGLRPFLPFNPHWYAGSFVFIFDPVLFALLLLPVVLPPLLALVGSEVGARKPKFRGRGLAWTAVVLIAAYWSFRAFEHQQAVTLAESASVAAPVTSQADSPSSESTLSAALKDDTALMPATPPPVYLQPQRVLASPDPFNPWRWHMAMDFGPFVQLGEADTHRAQLTMAQNFFSRPQPTPTLLAAEASPLGRAYLDWSPMPLISVDLHPQADAPPGTAFVVTFQDPRFMGDVPLLRSRGAVPLSGAVSLDARNHVLQQDLDGRIQH